MVWPVLPRMWVLMEKWLAEGAGVVLSAQGVTTQLKTLLPLLKEQPEFTSLLGRKARQRVLDRYTLSRNISQLELMYEEILQERPLPVTQWA